MVACSLSKVNGSAEAAGHSSNAPGHPDIKKDACD